MGLFDIRPKKRAPYRVHRKRTFTEKQITKAEKQFWSEEAPKNPALISRLMEKRLGIEIPQSNPVKAQQEKIDLIVLNRIAARIESDPAFAEQLEQAKMDELAEGKFPGLMERDGEYGGYQPTKTFRTFLDDLREYRQVQNEMKSDEEGNGKKPSGGFLGIDKETLNLAVGNFMQFVLPTLLKGNQAATPAPKIFVVEVDGKRQGLTEEQYDAFNQQGRIKPLGLVEAPKLEPATEAKAVEPPLPPAPASVSVEPPKAKELVVGSNKIPLTESSRAYLKELLGLVDIEELAQTLPVEELIYELQADEPISEKKDRNTLLWSLLVDNDVEVILMFFEMFRSDAYYGEYVKTVVDSGTWLHDLSKEIKEKTEKSKHD